jgi:hypothetical protein
VNHIPKAAERNQDGHLRKRNAVPTSGGDRQAVYPVHSADDSPAYSGSNISSTTIALP